MKKINFLVIFWLIIALICFIVFLIHFSNLFTSLSYIIIPPEAGDYQSSKETIRSLIQSIPMILVVVTGFVLSLKQGLKTYHAL